MQRLQQQAEEKDVQAKRETEITDKLIKELAESRKTLSSVEDVQTQMSKMFNILDERHRDDRLELVMLAQEDSKVK